MRIAVVGLWHLGTVTAACLAAAGHEVVAIDRDPNIIAKLREGKTPVEEPGLADLIREQMTTGRLTFDSSSEPVRHAEVVWVTFDTPVDENDIADVDYVVTQAAALFPTMQDRAIMLISSQLRVGSTARLERAYANLGLQNRLRFAYSPENLRLGNAIEVFMKPDRVVVGTRTADERERLKPIWAPFTDRIEWMSVESAEMTKHALNAFLATSVTFINEIARICEQVGADAREVERGLKSEIRIGSRAYLHPGAAFAGGTLARDVMFLRSIAESAGIQPALFDGIVRSNTLHGDWVKTRLVQCIPTLQGKVVGILGLTYKPGTSTLRRSSAVEVARWLLGEGASVKAFDPAVHSADPELPAQVQIENAVDPAIDAADALLVLTAWPHFRLIEADVIARKMKSAIVIDPSGHLERTLGQDQRISYHAVGRMA